MTSNKPALIIVMGCSGCGKSSIGLAVAQELGLPFVDGDDLHPATNVLKMSSGQPLDDQDRIPWLHRIRNTAIILTSSSAATTLAHEDPAHDENVNPSDELAHALVYVNKGTVEAAQHLKNRRRRAVVVGCSALRRCYRDLLRGKEAIINENLIEPGQQEQAMETFFLYLHGTRALLLNRIQHRPGHFFKAEMLDSQLMTLEEPQEDEHDVAHIKLGKGDQESEEIGLQGVIEKSVQAAEKWVGRKP